MAVTTKQRVQLPVPRRAIKMVQRNLVVYRHTWMVIFSGFFEPLFYLAAIGFGVGSIVEAVPYKGLQVAYAAYMAPGMLAASTLNGAVADGFFNPFFKLHYQKTYDGVLATPMTVPDIALGEMMWAQIRGSLYSIGFLVVMLALGLILSPWGLLAFPAAMLSAAALSSGAMLLTSIVKEISAFDWVMNLIVFPMFLFSGTFFDVEVYPELIQPVVKLSPLYHSASLLRSLTLGTVGPDLLVHVAYLVGMFALCATIAARRLSTKLVV